jgi:hypothetical protein
MRRRAHDNSNVPRDTLIDFFRDLIAIRADFLVYDDGYRRRSYTYDEVAGGARLRAQAQRGGPAEG